MSIGNLRCHERPVQKNKEEQFEGENREWRMENRKTQERKRQQAWDWLKKHGVYWLAALELEPAIILEVINDR